jgi:hypothetical protein
MAMLKNQQSKHLFTLCLPNQAVYLNYKVPLKLLTGLFNDYDKREKSYLFKKIYSWALRKIERIVAKSTPSRIELAGQYATIFVFFAFPSYLMAVRIFSQFCSIH